MGLAEYVKSPTRKGETRRRYGAHFVRISLFGIPQRLRWEIVISQLPSLPATIYYQLKNELFDLSVQPLLLST